MTRMLTLPKVQPVDTGEDDLVHRACCNRRALCDGSRLTGEEVDDDDGVDCVVCVELYEQDRPCGAPFCRLRQWIRGHR